MRPKDRRDTAVAFGTLVAILAAHAMLETARDALFLDKLPAKHLPLAYLAIAALALVVSKLNQQAIARVSRRLLLSASLLVGGLITASFFHFTRAADPLTLGALYVWCGLLATIVVVQFWLQLADVLDVSQAKRVFAVIGAGGLVGATLGSVLAGALLAVVHDARVLLPVSGGLFVVAAILSLGFKNAAETEEPRRRRHPPPARTSTLQMVRSDGYLSRLFFMVLVGAVLVTGVDYLFKATVAAEAKAAGWELGSFFARYYAVVNGLSLLVQLLLAQRLLRMVGVSRALWLLPGLLLLGSLGFALTVGLLPVLLLKGSDGALRHSVHRTASEILYLPLQRNVRERFKAFAEAVGQRGGQALASLIILAATSLSATPQIIGLGLVAIAALWVVTMIGLQPRYLELFRKQLRDGMLDRDVDIPDLDLASFELLVSTLSAEDDAEVIAALEMFESYGKTDLVPALILYHPSREVVLHGFEMFAKSDRQDVRRLISRLLGHEDEQIRAAALRTLSATEADEERLRQHLDDSSPAVRCTALVCLISAGLADERETTVALRKMVRGDCGGTRMALARALRQLPSTRFAWVYEELGQLEEEGLAIEVAHSIAAAPDARFVPLLVPMLALRGARSAARRALVAIGEPALAELTEALHHQPHAQVIRIHLPRTISQFANHQAAAALLAALPDEEDSRVVFKILRGLGAMRASDPTIPIDREVLLEVARQTLERAVTALHWRLGVEQVVAVEQAALTPAAELLLALLDEHEQAAMQRVFRLLHVIEPTQQFRIIYDGLRSSDSKAKASSRELLSHVVPPPLRDGILAMVDDLPDGERLVTAAPFYDPPGRLPLNDALALVTETGEDGTGRQALGRAYAAILRAMLNDDSGALRSLVSYHIAELGLEDLRGEVAAATQSTDDVLAEVARRALELFESGPTPELSSAR